MKHLCDSNVFIALTVEAHPHHAAALEWLNTCPTETTLYFCRQTQTTFLRLLTLREAMKENVSSNEEAIKAYQKLQSDSRIGFISEEPDGLEKQWFQYATSLHSSPNRWMDAYLAAFARVAKMSFITFDHGFESFLDLDLVLLR